LRRQNAPPSLQNLSPSGDADKSSSSAALQHASPAVPSSGEANLRTVSPWPPLWLDPAPRKRTSGRRQQERPIGQCRQPSSANRRGGISLDAHLTRQVREGRHRPDRVDRPRTGKQPGRCPRRPRSITSRRHTLPRRSVQSQRRARWQPSSVCVAVYATALRRAGTRGPSTRFCRQGKQPQQT